MTQSEHYAADAGTGFTQTHRLDERLAGQQGQFDPFRMHFSNHLFWY
jgi:hypothetical protein